LPLGVFSADGFETRRDADEGLHHRRIEVRCPAFDDELDRVVVRHRRPIQRPGGGRVVNVDDGHHAALDWNFPAAQPARIPGAVPSLVMGVDDVFRHRENRVVAHADAAFGLQDHFVSVLGMPLHLLELVGSQCAGLIQDVIGDADLADVVQRRQARDQIDPFGRQVALIFRIG
jgi:hypothetical protein